jgi:AcrR family transcriptional regulator
MTSRETCSSALASSPDSSSIRARSRSASARAAASLTKAAAEVFKSKGYHNATIDDIADAAGVSRPTVYKYTPSKRALLDSMVDAVLDAVSARLHKALATADPPNDKLRRLITIHVETATSMQTFYGILFSEETELSDEARARFHSFSAPAAPWRPAPGHPAQSWVSQRARNPLMDLETPGCEGGDRQGCWSTWLEVSSPDLRPQTAHRSAPARGGPVSAGFSWLRHGVAGRSAGGSGSAVGDHVAGSRGGRTDGRAGSVDH